MTNVTIAEKSHRPALRLVSTKELSRDAWLNVRKDGIGSSDAAAAVGLNPYQSQLELWLVKTDRDAGMPKIDPKDENSPMYWGSLLEPIVAAHYTRRSGNRVRRVIAVLQHPDPNNAWMLANRDYTVVAPTTCRSWNARPLASSARVYGVTAFPSMCSAKSSTSSP